MLNITPAVPAVPCCVSKSVSKYLRWEALNIVLDELGRDSTDDAFHWSENQDCEALYIWVQESFPEEVWGLVDGSWDNPTHAARPWFDLYRDEAAYWLDSARSWAKEHGTNPTLKRESLRNGWYAFHSFE